MNPPNKRRISWGVEWSRRSSPNTQILTQAPKDGNTAAIAVTHLVTDFPLETHVFVSLLMKLPVYVGTRRGVWSVEGDRIQFLGDQDLDIEQ